MKTKQPITHTFLVGAIALVAITAWGIYNLFQSRPKEVVRINHLDPELQAAIKTAKAGLDGFIKELAAPQPDEGFAVKGTFLTPEGAEYLWVKHPKFKDGSFSGILDQQPIALAGKQKGDTVRFPKKDAVDWLIKDDQGTRGAYTEKVLGNR